jgi:hypothetical protein
MNAQQLPTADFEEICTLDRVLAKPTKNHPEVGYIQLRFRRPNKLKGRVQYAYINMVITPQSAWHIKQVVTQVRGEWPTRFDTGQHTPRALFLGTHGSKVRLEGRYTTLYGPTDIDKARTIIEWRVVGRVDEPQS